MAAYAGPIGPVDAIQWVPGATHPAVCEGACARGSYFGACDAHLHRENGVTALTSGVWVVTQPDGNFDTCADADFAAIYAAV